MSKSLVLFTIICGCLFANPQAHAQPSSQIAILESFTAALRAKGYEPLDRTNTALSRMIEGDQVWFDPKSKKQIIALVGPKIEKWPRNELTAFNENFGYVYKHDSGLDVGLGFYDGFSELEAEELILELKSAKSASNPGQKLETDCQCTLAQAPANPSKLVPLDITSEEIFGPASSGVIPGTAVSQAFSCMKDVVQGVWNSTGGQVVNGVEVIRDPKKAWDEAHQVFDGVRKFVAEYETEMKKLFPQFLQLDRQTIATILCSMIGEIGGNTLVSMLTSGAGLPLAINRIKTMLGKLAKVSSLMDLMGKAGAFLPLRERFNRLLQELIRSDKPLPGEIQKDIETFSSLKMPELAMDSLECGL